VPRDQTDEHGAEEAGAGGFAFDGLLLASNESADEPGDQPGAASHAIRNKAREHGGEKIERGPADGRHLLNENGRFADVRAAGRCEQMKLKGISQRESDKNSTTGDERNDMRNAGQKILLMFLKNFAHANGQIDTRRSGRRQASFAWASAAKLRNEEVPVRDRLETGASLRSLSSSENGGNRAMLYFIVREKLVSAAPAGL